MKVSARLFTIILIAVFIISCKPVPVSHWFPVTPLEYYEKELYKEKLETTQAGQTWFRVGKEVLNDSLFSVAPFQERFFLGDSVPAQAIRIKIPEGRKLVIAPSRIGNDTARLFLELYKIKTNKKLQRIDYLKDDQSSITYSNQTGDTLLIRLQTGVNEQLTVSLSLTTLPSLAFPVARHNMSNVISFWGAERDRGVRSHEGIDIQAKRGTPAVAAENGFVTHVGTNNLGGKVIFMSPSESPYSLYYAHLDSQLVSAGSRVLKGDTLGLVGNTGNAITTAPHLHFGIYAQSAGAVNPLPFIDDRKEKIRSLPEVSPWLGDSVRIRKKVNLFVSSQFLTGEQITSLPQNTTVRVIGETTKGYRIVLENGSKGYIPTVPVTKISEKKYFPE